MKAISAFIILLLVGFMLTAQVPVTKSTKTVKENGKTYYLHTVESGQTLYSISKAYGVSISDISKENAIYSNTISAGQQLKIPNKSAVSGNSDEKDFIWHRVQAGETVYSIAKKFGVSVADIYFYNKRSAYGLAKNMILKIPNSKKASVDFGDDKFYYHTVVSGNTLFSISQQYGVSLAQIELFNPETKSGLKAGQVLKIPKSNYDATERLPVSRSYSPNLNNLAYDPLYFEEEGVTPCNRYAFDRNKTYNIAVLLPLYIKKNLWYGSKYKKEGDRMFYKNSQRFIEMYEGMLLAFQRLKQDGVSLNVQVYDTQNSAVEMQSIISDLDFKNLDLIIGPVYSKNIKLISYYAKKYKVNLISPLSSNLTLLENNPFVFNVTPSDEMRVKKAADFISRTYDSCIVIVHNGTPEEKKRIEIYKQKLVKSFTWNRNINEIIIKNINFNYGGSEALEKALSKGHKNIILVPSKNEVFITKIVETLIHFTDDYEIKLIGSPEWELFQNVDLTHLQKEEFHYVSPVYVDYNNWRVQSFMRKYQAAYETEPSLFAFKAYDIVYYFGTALKVYGKHFQFCLSPYDKYPNRRGLAFDFNFARSGMYNGFENNGMFMLKYTPTLTLEAVNP